MITYRMTKFQETSGVTSKYLVDIACLSTDTKPTDGIVTGSIALEVDTGDIYAYDEAGEEWNKIS